MNTVSTLALNLGLLQQYLPLAVLKPSLEELIAVAKKYELQQYLPLAVLKLNRNCVIISFLEKLQQYLPLAVLKPNKSLKHASIASVRLQQYLPLAVLKPDAWYLVADATQHVATVPTACGIETLV